MLADVCLASWLCSATLTVALRLQFTCNVNRLTRVRRKRRPLGWQKKNKKLKKSWFSRLVALACRDLGLNLVQLSHRVVLFCGRLAGSVLVSWSFVRAPVYLLLPSDCPPQSTPGALVQAAVLSEVLLYFRRNHCFWGKQHHRLESGIIWFITTVSFMTYRRDILPLLHYSILGW